MKRSVQLAAKAHNVAIVLLLVCGTALGALSIAATFFPTVDRAAGRLTGLLFSLLGIAFAIMVATGFHIAVADAVGRIERREKGSTSRETLR